MLAAKRILTYVKALHTSRGSLTSHSLAADLIVALVIRVEEVEELIGGLDVADAGVVGVIDEISTEISAHLLVVRHYSRIPQLLQVDRVRRVRIQCVLLSAEHDGWR
jgi:hypothetical protein